MALTSLDTKAGTLTASTTQSLAGARTAPVTADYTVLTVNNANDAILLPPIAPGKIIFIKNTSANAARAYVDNGGTIDGTAGATGVAVAANKVSLYTCTGYTQGTVGMAPVLVTIGTLA